MVAKNNFSFDRSQLPSAFVQRRLHSLTGAWLVLYLFYHLLVNSQAGLFLKDHGHHFIKMVNALEDIPFLSAVEILFIGFPFVIHGIWGLLYLRQAKMNSFPTIATKPVLSQYSRNRAYSWQRITSYILFFAIAAHVIHMRFFAAPKEVSDLNYRVEVSNNFQMEQAAQTMKMRVEKEGEKLIAYSDEPGKGFLLMVRNSFMNPYMAIAYSFLVFFSCYHAFNGVWTFLITWGITLTPRSQRYAKIVTHLLMVIVIFLGLFAIWGGYAEAAFT